MSLSTLRGSNVWHCLVRVIYGTRYQSASFSLIAVGIGFSLPAWLLFVWYCLRMVALLAHSAALGCSQSPSIIAHHF